MVILVYGDDSFRAREKVNELKAAFAKKFDPTGFNLSVFPDQKTGKIDVSEVFRSAAAAPFMATKRMVVAQDFIALAKKDEEKNKTIVEGLPKIPTDTILVLWETAEPKELEKKPLFKKLEKISEVHFYPFPKLEGTALSKWTSQRIVGYGATVAPEALRALIERAGDDLWQLNSEIQKLVAYADGEQITKEMVDKLVRASFDSNIFALMDAVSSHKAAQVLQLLEEERASGAHDGYIFSMLLRQIRILLSVRLAMEENPRANQNEIASILDLHPFVAGKAVQQARNVSVNKLRQIHDLLYAFDTGMKSGKYTDKISVDLVVVELLK